MKKQLLLLVMMISAALSVSAVEVEIDGLWYEIITKGNIAKVIHYKDNMYSGNIVIPENVDYGGATYSVTSIEDYAFHYCHDMTSVTIPKSLRSIGEQAFLECRSLESVHITDLEAWCKIAFSNPGSNPIVHAHLFLNGEDVRDLVIPNSVTSIGNYAFYGCNCLTSITISDNVTNIGEWAFFGCI